VGLNLPAVGSLAAAQNSLVAKQFSRAERFVADLQADLAKAAIVEGH
jgi:hypothetical protein